MKTEYLLMARFETPVVKLRDICEEFFGVTPKTAEQKAKAQALPVPVFKLRDSEKSPSLVSIQDLAAYIDKQRAEAQNDWAAIQAAH